MRLFTAALVTETNTFSPFPTGLAAFEACGISRHEADYAVETFFTDPVRHVRALGRRDGHEVVAGVSAYADPAGPTERRVYEGFRDEILEAIASRGPFDGVILTLHGAMVANGYEDCEGDLLARVRALVGPGVFVGAMLDPHCHLSPAMVAAANVLTLMKEYPHTDGRARLEQLYDLFVAIRVGAVRPVSALVDCRMIGAWLTTDPSVRALVDRISAREAGRDVLAIGFAHGFPWGDTADAGARVLVVANGRPDLAAEVALAVAEDIRAERGHALMGFTPVEAALADIALRAGRPAVLADVADNPGGGAPGDSTFILRAVLDAGLKDIAFASFWDPPALRACLEAGVGAELAISLGGRHGPVSGAPVALGARVRAVSEAHAQAAPDGATIPLGPSAWIEANGLHVVLTASRFQAVDPSVFTGLGLDLDDLAAVVVKSSNHFRAGFAPIAARIINVGTPGALSLDFARIPYRRRPAPYWPRAEDPGPPRLLWPRVG